MTRTERVGLLCLVVLLAICGIGHIACSAKEKLKTAANSIPSTGQQAPR